MGCRWRSSVIAAAGLIAVVIGVIISSSTPLRTDDSPMASADKRNSRKRAYAFVCLVYGAVGYLIWIALTFTPLTDGAKVTNQFIGLITAPLVLMSVALFLALYAVSWRVRSTWRRRTSAVVLTLGAVALLLSQVLSVSTYQWILTGAAVALVLIHLLISRTSQTNPGEAEGESDAGELRFRAWRGQGAAVVMLLSLFVSMALSSLLVLGVAAWLGTPEPGKVERIWRTPGEPLSITEWNVPDAYERFAVLLLVVVVAILILLIVVACVLLSKLVRFTLPALAWKGDPPKDEGDAESRGGVERPGETYPEKLVEPDERVRIRASTRRSSHVLHRGEPLFAWIAVFAAVGFFSLSSSIIFDQARQALENAAPGLPAGLRTTSTAILVGLALAAVAAVVANAATRRPRAPDRHVLGRRRLLPARRSPVRATVLRRAGGARARGAHAQVPSRVAGGSGEALVGRHPDGVTRWARRSRSRRSSRCAVRGSSRSPRWVRCSPTASPCCRTEASCAATSAASSRRCSATRCSACRASSHRRCGEQILGESR